MGADLQFERRILLAGNWARGRDLMFTKQRPGIALAPFSTGCLGTPFPVEIRSLFQDVGSKPAAVCLWASRPGLRPCSFLR